MAVMHYLLIVLLHLLFVTIMFFRSLRGANIDEFVIIAFVNYADCVSWRTINKRF
jgi:uncharacterized membrane protein YwzB